MISLTAVQEQCRGLSDLSGDIAIYDLRIDGERLADAPERELYAKHQALLRSYQGRYVLLPPGRKNR